MTTPQCCCTGPVDAEHVAQVDRELRHGVSVGVLSTGDIVPRPKEGRHVRLSMRCRASGDRWVLMIKDQTGPGRHRVGLSVDGIKALVDGTHPRRDLRDAG